jgi:hypothetical protein
MPDNRLAAFTDDELEILASSLADDDEPWGPSSKLIDELRHEQDNRLIAQGKPPEHFEKRPDIKFTLTEEMLEAGIILDATGPEILGHALRNATRWP